MPARNKIDTERVKQLLAQGVRPVDISRRLGCTKNGLSTAMAKMRKDGVL
jgi:DNA-binding CsgD family transcriptional regulator